MNERLRIVRETLTDSNGKKYSQTKFAEEMRVTRDMIATYEIGRVEPSPVFIDSLCNKFGISEEWLRTGSGEMFKPKEREEEIADMVKKMATDDDLFRFKVSQLLYSMNAEQIAVLKKYIKKLADAMDEE